MLFSLIVLVAGGCTTQWALPEVQTIVNGVRVLCAGGTYAEAVTLHGSPNDAALTWIEFASSHERLNVVWPAGYFARFSPTLTVFGPDGRLVAEEGDRVSGGCPMPNGELVSF